jgi:predicted nucleic acid-binding protein
LIVVDTNVLAYLLLLGPRTEKAEILRRQERQWAAPPLWRSEFRNVLTGYLRRDLLDLSRAVALMEEAELILPSRIHRGACGLSHDLHKPVAAAAAGATVT